MNTRALMPAVLLFITSITACKKNIDAGSQPGTNGIDTTHTTKADTGARVDYPQQIVTRCPGAPSYGDSIIFLQPSNTDYIVTPINQPDTGTYFAWPQGMVIDRNSGAINVSKSEGGLRYSIGYVKKGTTDTCLQTLILAGISYEDSLYVLSNDQRFAEPYYNADPTLTPVCSGVPGNSGCRFDITGQANSQHVIIDRYSGFIDLKNTAIAAFGLIPLNGTKVTTTFAYQLNDNSNMATQYITVDLIYYNKKSDVPPSLLAAVTDKLNKILNQVLLINLGDAGKQANNGNPRPPIIIVTRSAQ